MYNKLTDKKTKKLFRDKFIFFDFDLNFEYDICNGLVIVVHNFSHFEIISQFLTVNTVW